MVTVTIPKKITKGDELVIIPRKEFEKLLRPVKKKKLDPDLAKALADVKAGRLIGPFKNVEEFKKAIERRHS